jgi:hypothetical protein
VRKRALSSFVARIGNRNRAFPEEHREDVDTGPLLLETLNRTVTGVVGGVDVVVVAASMFVSVCVCVYIAARFVRARKSLCGDSRSAFIHLGSRLERLTGVKKYARWGEIFYI